MFFLKGKNIEDSYEEIFSDDDVHSAFVNLLNVLQNLWQSVDFSILKEGCARYLKNFKEIRCKIQVTTALNELIDVLDEHGCCCWLELRALDNMAKIAGVPEAKQLIKLFKLCVHGRKVSSIEKRFFNPDFLYRDHDTYNMAAKLNFHQNNYVTDLISSCRKLETKVRSCDGECILVECKPDQCVEINFFLPLCNVSQAYNMLKSCRLELRQFHVRHIQIDSTPKIFVSDLNRTKESLSMLNAISTLCATTCKLLENFCMYCRDHTYHNYVSLLFYLPYKQKY